MGRLILIMIDGISVDHFERDRARLPHLDRIAAGGTRVAGVGPETCATSSPGRTSIIAGVSPAEHGIYGNRIYVEGGFRWANPWDVRCDTLPALASRQGLDVAGIGYGMVRPEDCSVYQGPWWAGEMMMGGAVWKQANQCWRRAGGFVDAAGRLQALADAGATRPVVAPNDFSGDKLQLGMLADQQLLDVAAGLACSERPPDFILLEIAITDYFLHKYGAEHPLVECSLRAADAQIGTLLARLERGGILDQYNFAVLSDHGHAAAPTGFYVDRVLKNDVAWSSEGGVLLVRAETPESAAEVREALASHGMQEWDSAHVPGSIRGNMLTFVMPEGAGMSFESARPGTTGVTGPSKYVSNHGMRPGTRSDFRFCIFGGPDVPCRAAPAAGAIQVAPTLAKILGVETPWEAAPLF